MRLILDRGPFWLLPARGATTLVQYIAKMLLYLQGWRLVGGLSQVFSARELKAAFAAIATDNLLDGNVLVGLDLIPYRDGDRLAKVFQGLPLPRSIIPEIERLLGRR